MAVRANPPPEELDPRLAELYRTASIEEPPSRIDQAIRSAARTGTPRREARAAPGWMAWRVPLAVASVAVVSATLAILVREERPETVAEAPAPPLAPAIQPALPPPPAIQPAPPPPAADERLMAAPQAALPPLREPAPQRKTERAEAAGAVQAPPPVLPPMQPRADLPQPFPAAPAPPPTPAEPQAVAPSAAADAAKRAAPAVADETRQQRTAPSATIGIRGLEAQDSRREAPRPEANPRASVSAPAPLAKPAPAAAPKPEVSRARAFGEIGALTSELQGEPPQRWLERVASLRRDGRNTEADALLAEFRKRFPNESVPLSLE